jgi:hypothetical protein
MHPLRASLIPTALLQSRKRRNPVVIQLMMFFLPPPNGSTLLKSRRPSRAVNGSILGWYESILTNLSYWQVVPVPGYFRTTIEGGERPRSRDISKPQLRVPPVPRFQRPGMPQTSTRNPFTMLPVNLPESALRQLFEIPRLWSLKSSKHPIFHSKTHRFQRTFINFHPLFWRFGSFSARFVPLPRDTSGKFAPSSKSRTPTRRLTRHRGTIAIQYT